MKSIMTHIGKDTSDQYSRLWYQLISLSFCPTLTLTSTPKAFCCYRCGLHAHSATKLPLATSHSHLQNWPQHPAVDKLLYSCRAGFLLIASSQLITSTYGQYCIASASDTDTNLTRPVPRASTDICRLHVKARPASTRPCQQLPLRGSTSRTLCMWTKPASLKWYSERPSRLTMVPMTLSRILGKQRRFHLTTTVLESLSHTL